LKKWGVNPNSSGQSEFSQVDTRLSEFRWRDVNRLFGVDFPLVAQIPLKSAFMEPKRSNMETQINWVVALLGWKTLGLALKAFFFVSGKTRIDSLQDLA